MLFPTSENQAGHYSKAKAVAGQQNGLSHDLRIPPHKNQQIYGLQYSTDGLTCSKGFTVLKVVSHIIQQQGEHFSGHSYIPCNAKKFRQAYWRNFCILIDGDH
jgi:hypothetical protein